jgi:hypothetical protein
MTGHRLLRQRLLTGLGWALVALVLAAVFALYTDTEFMLLMADQVWACF